MKTLDELKEEEKIILKSLLDNRESQKLLLTEEFSKKHGINIGDNVEWMDGRKLKRGVVSKIEYSGHKPNYFWAALFNADGKVGAREMRIWNFQFDSIKKI